MARILILGGAGFIGYHLGQRVSQEPGHSVTLVDDLSRGRMDPDLAALLSRRAIHLVRADLTDPGAFADLPRQWDQVYMLAAVVGVRNAVGDPARVIRVNTLVTLNLLEWLPPATGVVFFASTSETYAGGMSLGQLPVPTPETVPLSVAEIRNPRFAYAASKILGEAATIHYGAAKGLRFVIGRLHNVYGPRMGTDHVIPELCLRALDREDPFRVYGPEQRRAFCHVTDAVEAILRLTGTEGAWGEIVNIGNDAEETPVGDLLGLILRAADFSPRILSLPAPEGSVARRCPDLSKLRRLTGFTPKISLDAGVSETFEWYRAWRNREGVGRTP
ncbi:MAG: NAD-dependent epimerase/dehydratase family protein [Candidatus Rokubacteria bacterium]|nr:NAD-dependent epimerase/dehydratase family protein [Candidatus Rokubacteria bacterium]